MILKVDREWENERERQREGERERGMRELGRRGRGRRELGRREERREGAREGRTDGRRKRESSVPKVRSCAQVQKNLINES